MKETRYGRAMALAILLLIAPHAAGQSPGLLRLRVVVADADGTAVPMPRVLLLISDNPATAEPRRIITRIDGTAEVRLPPGNYTVESDQPIAFGGTAYQWTQFVDVRPTGDTVLELTAKNAETRPATAGDATTSVKVGAASMLARWQESVVEVWSPTAHASAFLVDAAGLLATNQRVVGNAASVEVQLSPAIKVAGTVVASDPARGVAIIWIDPAVVAPARPLPLRCDAPPAVQIGQELFTIAVPLFAAKAITSGAVTRSEAQELLTDVRLATDSSGGPVFTIDGEAVGLTTFADDSEGLRMSDARVVPIRQACDVIAIARQRMAAAAPPSGTRLPVEASIPPAVIIGKVAAPPKVSPAQFQLAATDFDLTFLTPMLVRAAGSSSAAFADFGAWTPYVTAEPPVVMVRVTPQFEESLWKTLARGAAQTQGVALPPLPSFRSNFSHLRAYCGDAEVTPIHPLTIDRRVSEKGTIREGLYVFDPAAFGTHCATVRFVLYAEKDPQKGETRTVDPKLMQQLAQQTRPVSQ